jgi:hypothetical protein
MVEYIRGNVAGDSFTRSQDRYTRRRLDEEARNRQMAVDEATRKGLRRILASGTTAPASASQPSGGVNLPSGSFSGSPTQIAPTPSTLPPQQGVEPTISPTPMPAQPAPSNGPAYIADSPLGGAGLTAALGGDGMPPALSGAMNRPPYPLTSDTLEDDPYFGGMAESLADFQMPRGPQPPTEGGQPLGYDALDSALPEFAVGGGRGVDAVGDAGSDALDTGDDGWTDTVQGAQGQDDLAGGAGYGMLPAQVQAESGGRQMDPRTGGVITSSAGAKGIAQVMPTTGPEAAALAGIPWDEALYNDPGPAGEAYSMKLGDAYFEEMKRQFDGNIVLATAAYNAGPGRVRQSLRTGQPLPAETQAYLDKIFGSGGQGAVAPRGNVQAERGDLRQMVAERPSGMMQYGPILEELAEAPGGGEAALRLLGNANARDQRLEGDQLQLEQTFARDDDAMERLAMTALAHGDMDTFDYWSQRSGIQVPQQVLADKRQASLFGRGALLAEQFYKGDQQQAVQFIQGYMQGGPQAGFAAAGAPISNQRVTLRDVQVGDQRLIARIGQSGQNLGYVTGTDGQPVQSATGARTGFGAGQDASVKRRDYEALIPQLGEALARATVYGQNGLNPGERYLRAWLEEAPKMGIQVNEQSLAEAKKTADLINQQLGEQTAVPASQSVTDAGVEAPGGIEPDAGPGRITANGGQFYSEDGGQTWFDLNGNPYEEPTE